MNDLYPILAGTGGVIVVTVFGYNKWQEYKAKKNVERAFSNVHDDVLMSPDLPPDDALARLEPVFDSADPGYGTDAHDDTEQVQVSGTSATTAATADKTAAADGGVRKVRPSVVLPVDDMIDCSIVLALNGDTRGEKLMRALQGLRHVGSKPVHYVARASDGEWQAIAHGEMYAEVKAGAQLVNRSGVLNELEYSELVMRLRQIADELDAEPDIPDMSQVMQTARALQQVLLEFDAQLSVNVRSNGAPWAITTLLAALERQGFDVRPDGRLIMPDGEGGVLFTLSTNVTLAEETTPKLTLLLDVPRVSPSRDGYGAMVACAKMLAARLGGTVVDDGDQALPETSLAEIGGQVQEFYQRMELAGITPGSVRATRLFN